mgnify:CR=1 FL=1|jgi:hypothetical protein
MTEIAAVDTWLYTTLRASAELAATVGARIYDAQAPAGAAPPYVVFQLQAAGADTVVVGGIRIATNVLYAVRAVTCGAGYAAASTIAGHIDAALHGRRATITAGVVLSCHRERPLKLPPEVTEGGETYYHEGGIYRLRVRVQ